MSAGEAFGSALLVLVLFAIFGVLAAVSLAAAERALEQWDADEGDSELSGGEASPALSTAILSDDPLHADFDSALADAVATGLSGELSGVYSGGAE